MQQVSYNQKVKCLACKSVLLQQEPLVAEGLTADFQTKYETRVGYLGFTWFLGSNKPASTIDNQPQGDTGGFGG